MQEGIKKNPALVIQLRACFLKVCISKNLALYIVSVCVDIYFLFG